jgi:hypothetical protein
LEQALVFRWYTNLKMRWLVAGLLVGLVACKSGSVQDVINGPSLAASMTHWSAGNCPTIGDSTTLMIGGDHQIKQRLLFSTAAADTATTSWSEAGSGILLGNGGPFASITDFSGSTGDLMMSATVNTTSGGSFDCSFVLVSGSL